MRQLTRDHSLRKELFNPFDGEAHDFSHVLTQAIGPNANINPHVNISRVAEGDMVLLCSDGLTSVVPDVEIADVLSTASFGDVPNELLTRVLEKNGDDNVSIVLARVVDVLPLNCSQC
jgi:protein phosphatase